MVQDRCLGQLGEIPTSMQPLSADSGYSPTHLHTFATQLTWCQLQYAGKIKGFPHELLACPCGWLSPLPPQNVQQVWCCWNEHANLSCKEVQRLHTVEPQRAVLVGWE